MALMNSGKTRRILNFLGFPVENTFGDDYFRIDEDIPEYNIRKGSYSPFDFGFNSDYNHIMMVMDRIEALPNVEGFVISKDKIVLGFDYLKTELPDITVDRSEHFTRAENICHVILEFLDIYEKNPEKFVG